MPRVMSWNCHQGGKGNNCFNLKRRPKFAVFDDVFPRTINFTDVDGLVEIGGHFCLLEWKGDGGAVRRGQDLMFVRFTANTKNVVLVVLGDAEKMSVRAFGFYKDGVYHNAKPATIETLKNWLRGWARWADHPLDR